MTLDPVAFGRPRRTARLNRPPDAARGFPARPAPLAGHSPLARPAPLAGHSPLVRLAPPATAWGLLARLVPLAGLISLACLVLPACVGLGLKPPAPFDVPATRRLIPNVPFIPDDSSHCGPSTLAAVLTYHGRPTTKEEVAADVQREDLRGALGPDMVLWARAKGFKAGFKSAAPEEIVAAIDRLEPVIMLLDTGFGPVRKGHFVVAVGYSPDGLVVNTGEIQQALTPWSEILTSWRRLGNFTILIEGEAAPASPESSVDDPAAPVPAVVIHSPHPVPSALIGADLPLDRPGRESPVMDLTRGPAVIEAAPPEDSPSPSDPAAAEAAEGDVAEGDAPEALADGIVEESLGPVVPQRLPVIPLPENDPLAPKASLPAPESVEKTSAEAGAADPAAEAEKAANQPFGTGQRFGNPTPARTAAKPAKAAAPASGGTVVKNADPAQASAQSGQDQSGQPGSGKPEPGKTGDDQSLGNPSSDDDEGVATIVTATGQVLKGGSGGAPGAGARKPVGARPAAAQPQGVRPAVEQPTPPGVITLSPFLTEGEGGAKPPPKPPVDEPVPVMGWERGD